ncbi:MAG: YbhB/YbcL family Raf kinase inhibitor-like protein [Burkholderiaceae bacterium]|nr:YbhB/YbcL family Raf kinase inhibitor-like protein [Burkholderiaceae bacterium]
MRIYSQNFEHRAEIPKRFTQFDANISPAISIREVPATAKYLVLICSDPDAPDPLAPKRNFVHWVVYNLPCQDLDLPEAADISCLFDQAEEGINDRDCIGYIGPRPPIGTHRYFFKAYAVTKRIEKKNLTRQQVLDEIDGYVVDMAELIGLYSAP